MSLQLQCGCQRGMHKREIPLKKKKKKKISSLAFFFFYFSWENDLTWFPWKSKSIILYQFRYSRNRRTLFDVTISFLKKNVEAWGWFKNPFFSEALAKHGKLIFLILPGGFTSASDAEMLVNGNYIPALDFLPPFPLLYSCDYASLHSRDNKRGIPVHRRGKFFCYLICPEEKFKHKLYLRDESSTT